MFVTTVAVMLSSGLSIEVINVHDSPAKATHSEGTTMSKTFSNYPLTHDPERRFWLLATGVAGSAATIAAVAPFVSTFAPSERAKAAGGPVEVDIADIPSGGSKTVEWRGKPVWVVRRTPEMLAALQGHDAELVDPQSVKDQQPSYAQNAARALKPEIFIAVGICTHLGCSPSAVGAGLVLATQAVEQKVSVRVLLCDAAGDIAVTGKEMAILKPRNVTPQQMLQGLIKAGATVEVCALYLPNSGRTAADLLAGVTPAKPADVAAYLMKPGVRTLAF